MNLENVGGYTLNNLNKINILLGKNGCGKSICLKALDEVLSKDEIEYGCIKYITPERGGVLNYEPNFDVQISRDVKWISNTRRVNQYPQFRQQSVSQYKKLEYSVLRKSEKKWKEGIKFDYGFEFYISKINSLLDNIEIHPNDDFFEIYSKDGLSPKKLEPTLISSGESELISLGIECLVFESECSQNKDNILLLDEPDVHLHPDLQVRLMHFLKDIVEEGNCRVLIATHSTALLGALADYQHTNVAFMRFGQKFFNFKSISDIYKKILPVFGAHPLSNLFNQAPVFLVEGEDDERIWQQVVRTSAGKIKIYPVPCGSKDQIKNYESEVIEIIDSVYDEAKAYSLRDRDDDPGEVDDRLPVIRFKLSCRNAENLILCNEVLESLGTNWGQLKSKIDIWLKGNNHLQHFQSVKNFKDNGFERKFYDLKEIRNDLMSIIESSKPWEVAVGQVIASLTWDDLTDFSQDGSIYNYLGEKLVKELFPKN